MMWGSFGLFISMMMISILLSFKGMQITTASHFLSVKGLSNWQYLGTSVEKPTASASVAFFFLFMLIFGASVNCIPWVYGPEILPLHVRAKGYVLPILILSIYHQTSMKCVADIVLYLLTRQAIGISANWLWNFFVVMITPTLIENLAWKGYLIFMCLNLAFVPVSQQHPPTSLIHPSRTRLYSPPHLTLTCRLSTSSTPKQQTSPSKKSISFSPTVQDIRLCGDMLLSVVMAVMGLMRARKVGVPVQLK